MSLGANIEMAEKMYARWKGDRTAVAADWVNFFEGFELGMEGTTTASAPARADATAMQLQARVIGAIYKYRVLGHTQANINPLSSPQKNDQLSLERLGLTASDMDKSFDVGNYKAGPQQMKVGDLLKHLQDTYCGKIGVEYAHIQDSEKRYWLQARIEASRNRPNFDAAKKKRILKKILETETFENFLHTRFVGQKRFSLEGGETTIAAMDALLAKATSVGVKAYVLGMAHRGRLSVMTEVLGKPYKTLFEKFGGDYIPHSVYGSGDVKYHLGYSTEIDGVGMHLTPNPSHLEAVNPVVEGRARAMQRRNNDLEKRSSVAPVLIHGDAAFIGQGIVAETLNFSQLEGYRTGGTLHFVINNQVGFTAEPDETRSGRYCTDVAKMVEAPIFHVNGDDPEAVVYAMELSLDYRQKFGADVVVDMLCYRKHGHNESDEPRFTQPQMYAQIDQHPQVSKIYAAQLISEGVLSSGELEAWTQEKIATLEASLSSSKEKKTTQLPFFTKNNPFADSTHPQPQAKWSFSPVITSVPLSRLESLTHSLTEIPKSFSANAKIVRLMQQRRDTFAADKIDWGLAEQLSWGSLLLEGTHVRISGQDCVRGTFSHRHAGWYDTRSGERYEALNHLSDTQARFCAHNSCLSEAAVLGFDYGYSLDYPEMLCQWEAQFGDFANGAQSIIDQFIAASEMKWQTHSGLVMLLPHGYEGQGPEHSSARLERFLQLCAQENIQVANPSTPAQYFHLLRRQMKRAFLKPLVVMTPKSLLRLEDCVSSREDLVHGEFDEILDSSAEPKKVSRIIACSGKVFYDLENYRKAQKIDDVAILRVEQLYPFHTDLLRDILKRYKNAKSFVWCQEEPKNMGAWNFIRDHLAQAAGHEFDYAGRSASASPAAGALAVHKIEQQKLIEEAFKI